jgi:predicted PurR-regulated permease PerM
MTSIETPAPAPEQGTHRALRLAVGAAAVVVLMLGVSQFSDIVGPFFLALNLMIVVWPVQRFLAGHMPRVLASILSGLLAIVILGLFFWAIGWAASLFVQEIPLYKDQFQTMYDQALNMLSQFGVTSSQIIDQLKSINPSSVVSVVGSLISNIGSVVSLLVVVITVLLFMIVDSIDFQTRMERLGEKHNPVLVLALQSFAQGVRSYWVTSTVFGLGVSLLTWGGLAAYGIPLAIVWAVLSFVTNYIPNVGFIIGLVPAAVMGLLAKGPIGALYVIALYAVLNFVIQSVIQPKVTGDAVGVTSTVSFMSLLVWAVVLGPLGALLALPATLFIKALVVDADPKARWINAIIASNPRTSSEEPIIDTEEVDHVDPLVSQPVPAGDSGVFDPEVPRRAAEVAEENDAEERLDDVRVAPRRSAVELEHPTLDEPVRAVDEPAAEEAVIASSSAAAPMPEAFVSEWSAADESAAEAPVEGSGEPAPLAEAASGAESSDGAVAEPGVMEELRTEVSADEPVAEVDAAEDAAVQEPAVEEVEQSAPAADEQAADAGAEVDTEAEDEAPRRASDEVRANHEDEVDTDGWPVFQKSATPYWTGATAHAED